MISSAETAKNCTVEFALDTLIKRHCSIRKMNKQILKFLAVVSSVLQQQPLTVVRIHRKPQGTPPSLLISSVGGICSLSFIHSCQGLGKKENRHVYTQQLPVQYNLERSTKHTAQWLITSTTTQLKVPKSFLHLGYCRNADDISEIICIF